MIQKVCFPAYFHVSDNNLEESPKRAAFLLDHSLHFREQLQR